MRKDKKKLNTLFLDSAGEPGPRSRTHGWVHAAKRRWGWWVPHTPAPTEHCRDKQELALLGSLSLECPALSLSHPQPPRVSMLRGGHGASLLEEPWRKKPLVKG